MMNTVERVKTIGPYYVRYGYGNNGERALGRMVEIVDSCSGDSIEVTRELWDAIHKSNSALETAQHLWEIESPF